MASVIPRNSPKSPFSGFAGSPKFPEPPYRGVGIFGGKFRGSFLPGMNRLESLV